MSDRPSVIGLGELLWDVFPDSRRPGGAPANVAFHAAQFGATGLVASRVGQDDDGRELIEFLQSKGLSTALIQQDDQHPTGRVTVSLSEGGQPSYVIHENSAWDFLAPADALLSAARTAAAICFGTLAQRNEASRDAIQRVLKESGDSTLVVYDVNLRQNWYCREWIESSLRAADVFKLNHEELVILSDLLEVGSSDPREFVTAMRERFGVSIVCITRGEHGCLLSDGVQWYDIPGEPVQVVDAVGAGDAFTAALIVGLLNGLPLERAGRSANRIGGLVASRAGAMPFLDASLRTL